MTNESHPTQPVANRSRFGSLGKAMRTGSIPTKGDLPMDQAAKACAIPDDLAFLNLTDVQSVSVFDELSASGGLSAPPSPTSAPTSTSASPTEKPTQPVHAHASGLNPQASREARADDAPAVHDADVLVGSRNPFAALGSGPRRSPGAQASGVKSPTPTPNVVTPPQVEEDALAALGDLGAEQALRRSEEARHGRPNAAANKAVPAQATGAVNALDALLDPVAPVASAARAQLQDIPYDAQKRAGATDPASFLDLGRDPAEEESATSSIAPDPDVLADQSLPAVSDAERGMASPSPFNRKSFSALSAKPAAGAPKPQPVPGINDDPQGLAGLITSSNPPRFDGQPTPPKDVKLKDYSSREGSAFSRLGQQVATLQGRSIALDLAAAKVLTPLVSAVSMDPSLRASPRMKAAALARILKSVKQAAADVLITFQPFGAASKAMRSQLMQVMAKVAAERWREVGDCDIDDINATFKSIVDEHGSELADSINELAEIRYEPASTHEEGRSRLYVTTTECMWRLCHLIKNERLALEGPESTMRNRFFTYGREPHELAAFLMDLTSQEVRNMQPTITQADMQVTYLQSSLQRVTDLVGAIYVRMTSVLLDWAKSPAAESDRQERLKDICVQFESLVVPEILKEARDAYQVIDRSARKILDDAIQEIPILSEKSEQQFN